MSLVRLRTFMEVYRQRSISGAARALNLTQPAVSQHISGLEVAIGRPLFERQPQGVLPTPAAEDLAADIGNSLDTAESALASARARSMDVSGTLQIIGHADFMADKLAGELLPLLESGIRVHMHTGDGPLVTQMVVEGHCDLGITAHPVTDSRLKGEVIFRDEVLAVASPGVASRLNASADFATDLLREPLLAYNLELSLIDHWLEKNRISYQTLLPAMVGQDLRGQRSLLVQGFGWSVMPQFLCQQQIEQGELVALHAPVGDTEIRYNLVWLASALRQPRVAHARQTLVWRLNRAE
ncbi:LysR family transcriptional regulator [Pantoea phytobeneficialis]|uniref:LysR family transcriptional regulator n=1 Tax=Pantoea phytobeneficialis TaxID=2052056 RepID=A0AAP9HB60_9GAMM|nr:LysR family transcriptional regulator [Pantoea phytobeneficialis]MDO6409683.1 LysR family transcriptional regulator [Pantoea phytobeneficialis]QGR10023.1 LysR family transcriptional regulator [Pantoea phytobeneficialis]